MNKKMNMQRGMTLVSLMVASVIGLFIIAAALSMYSNSQNTYKTRQAASAAAENGRYALSDLRSTIVMAGRGMDGASSRDVQAIDKTFTSMPALSVLSHSDGGTGGSDQISFRMAQGRDCLGNVIPTVTNTEGKTIGTVTTITYSIQTNGDGINELVCSVDGGVPQALVSGIEMLKVVYGLDTNEDGYANQYLNADEMDTIRDSDSSTDSITKNIWEDIVSVRVGVISSSAEFRVPGPQRQTIMPTEINVLHGQLTTLDNALMYRSNTMTIAMRNLSSQ